MLYVSVSLVCHWVVLCVCFCVRCACVLCVYVCSVLCCVPVLLCVFVCVVLCMLSLLSLLWSVYVHVCVLFVVVLLCVLSCCVICSVLRFSRGGMLCNGCHCFDSCVFSSMISMCVGFVSSCGMLC